MTQTTVICAPFSCKPLQLILSCAVILLQLTGRSVASAKGNKNLGLICQDKLTNCPDRMREGQCNAKGRDLEFMDEHCNRTCGYCSRMEKCSNIAVDCLARWSAGGCFKHPDYMLKFCPKSCQVCGPGDRCRPDVSNAFFPGPGDMKRYFDELRNQFEHLQPNLLSEDPPVLVFDSFLSDNEVINSLARLSDDSDATAADDRFFENVAGSAPDMESDVRHTSGQRWCGYGKSCEADPRVQKVVRRIEEVTKANRDQLEKLQIYRYNAGQYDNEHADYVQHGLHIPAGPRVLTMFIYLSDVIEGGETHFPRLNISIKPARGRALLFADTMDSDPYSMDERTNHKSVAVGPGAGTKWMVNVRIHQFRYRVGDEYCQSVSKNLQYATPVVPHENSTKGQSEAVSVIFLNRYKSGCSLHLAEDLQTKNYTLVTNDWKLDEEIPRSTFEGEIFEAREGGHPLRRWQITKHWVSTRPGHVFILSKPVDAKEYLAKAKAQKPQSGRANPAPTGKAKGSGSARGAQAPSNISRKEEVRIRKDEVPRIRKDEVRNDSTGIEPGTRETSRAEL